MAFDTTAEADAAQREAWARMGDTGRFRAMAEMSDVMRRASLDGLAERHPDLDRASLIRRYVEEVHGIVIS